MPVHIQQPDALDRLCLVEGDAYRAEQADYATMRSCYREQSFVGWLDLWIDFTMDLLHASAAGEQWSEEMLDEPLAGLMPRRWSGQVCLYGYQGWNRYLVLGSGELVFHDDFADGVQSIIDSAVAAGFRTWRELRLTR